MSAKEAAIIKAYREAMDNTLIHWACGLRDTMRELTDTMLAQLEEARTESDQGMRAS